MPLLCYLVDTNPNDATGGGGSLAGEMHDADAKGPYFVWPAQEFESTASPHAVVAASEVEHMYRMLHPKTGEAEVGAGGESTDFRDAAPALAGVPQAENPTYDLEDPTQAADFLAAFSSDED